MKYLTIIFCILLISQIANAAPCTPQTHSGAGTFTLCDGDDVDGDLNFSAGHTLTFTPDAADYLCTGTCDLLMNGDYRIIFDSTNTIVNTADSYEERLVIKPSATNAGGNTIANGGWDRLGASDSTGDICFNYVELVMADRGYSIETNSTARNCHHIIMREPEDQGLWSFSEQTTGNSFKNVVVINNNKTLKAASLATAGIYTFDVEQLHSWPPISNSNTFVQITDENSHITNSYIGGGGLNILEPSTGTNSITNSHIESGASTRGFYTTNGNINLKGNIFRSLYGGSQDGVLITLSSGSANYNVSNNIFMGWQTEAISVEGAGTEVVTATGNYIAGNTGAPYSWYDDNGGSDCAVTCSANSSDTPSQWSFASADTGSSHTSFRTSKDFLFDMTDSGGGGNPTYDESSIDASSAVISFDSVSPEAGIGVFGTGFVKFGETSGTLDQVTMGCTMDIDSDQYNGLYYTGWKTHTSGGTGKRVDHAITVSRLDSGTTYYYKPCIYLGNCETVCGLVEDSFDTTALPATPTPCGTPCPSGGGGGCLTPKGFIKGFIE